MNNLLAEPVYWQLLKVCVRARHELGRLADKHDLSVMQLHTLCSIKPESAMPMSAISDLMSCDASNVTGVIDRLLGRGLITREENPDDRRVKMVGLTTKGEELRDTLLSELARREPEALQPLSLGEQHALRDLLGKLTVDS